MKNCIAFSSGIGITMVTGTGDSDATAVASGDLIFNLFYKGFKWQAILLTLLLAAAATKIETIIKRKAA